jgi:hypothetical protein
MRLFGKKLHTATIYFKSGNTITINDLASYSVEHKNGKPISFSFTYDKPRHYDFFPDFNEIEAIVAQRQ